MKHRASLLKRIGIALLASLYALVGMTILTIPAHAEHGNNGNLIGGLAAGALLGGILGSTLLQQNKPPPPPPPPLPQSSAVQQKVFIEDTPAPHCHTEFRKLFDEDGNYVGTRRVRVCP